jgi:hypothetical protein
VIGLAAEILRCAQEYKCQGAQEVSWALRKADVFRFRIVAWRWVARGREYREHEGEGAHSAADPPEGAAVRGAAGSIALCRTVCGGEASSSVVQ